MPFAIAQGYSTNEIFLRLRLPQRADFDGTIFCGWDFLRPTDRFVKVSAVDDRISTKLFMCLSEWTISDQRLPISHTDRCRSAIGIHSAVIQQYSRGFCFSHVSIPGLSNSLMFFRCFGRFRL